MTEVNIDYAAVAAAAAEAEDQTQMKEGGSFKREVPAEGRCMLRLKEYIEVGQQQPKNPAHKPRVVCLLRFEVNSPRHMIEIEGGEKIPNTIDVRVSKGGKKSKYGRLFSSMNRSGKYNHFAQMVGDGAWLAEITHNKADTGTDKEKTYANLDRDGAWTFTLPINEDVVTGESKPIPVPELHGDPRMFLWENDGLNDEQYKALFDSLFIEGETDEGKSKNWIQDLIYKAADFPKSRLKRILEGTSGGALEDIDLPEGDAAADSKETTAEPGKEPESAPEKAEEAADTSDAKATDSDADALAELGL